MDGCARDQQLGQHDIIPQIELRKNAINYLLII